MSLLLVEVDYIDYSDNSFYYDNNQIDKVLDDIYTCNQKLPYRIVLTNIYTGKDHIYLFNNVQPVNKKPPGYVYMPGCNNN